MAAGLRPRRTRACRHRADRPVVDERVRGPSLSTGRAGNRAKTFADRPPHRHRTAGARRGGSDHGPAGGHRAVPRLGGAARRAARDVIYWYFNEVPKLTDEVGVAAAEKLAASARGGR